jgi:hypothetical protein
MSFKRVGNVKKCLGGRGSTALQIATRVSAINNTDQGVFFSRPSRMSLFIPTDAWEGIFSGLPEEKVILVRHIEA